MTDRYLHALPQTGPKWEGEALTWPLGGSAHVWCESVNALHREDETAFLLASDLADADRARLTARRPDICGLSLDRPRIMAILNVTPDSFSDGGDHLDLAQAVRRAVAMSREADILDIGGESTRPGAADVSVAEEIRRTVPVIRAVREAGIATPVSIDTRKAEVAAAALEAGADMVNDVSALTYDRDLAPLVAARGVPLCLMHAQGDPATMQKNPRYDDVALDVFDFLARRVAAAEEQGIDRAQLIVDPGIGFGKTKDHNLILLRSLALFHDLGLPVLLGASRKRFIGTIGGAEEPKQRVAGSLAVALHAAAQGAQILRVHDVHATAQALRLHRALAGAPTEDA